jgi:hypothetical protein
MFNENDIDKLYTYIKGDLLWKYLKI